MNVNAKSSPTRPVRQFEQQLADGLTVAIELCTGYQRFSLGRPEKGLLGPPDVGETARVPVELQPGAVFVFGPELAPRGMTIDVDASAPVPCRDRRTGDAVVAAAAGRASARDRWTGRALRAIVEA